jgi:hypothetical protein
VAEEVRNTCRIFVGKSEIKRAVGRPGRRWEDNIEMGSKEIGCEVVD